LTSQVFLGKSIDRQAETMLFDTWSTVKVKWRINLYSESSRCMTKTVRFAALFRKQTTNLLNITTSAVPYNEEKFGLFFKWIVCRQRTAISMSAYRTDDLCLTSVPQQITLETTDRFTRNSAWQLSYISNYLNILRPNY